MQNSLKKGLVSIILGATSLSALGPHDLYSQGQKKNYPYKVTANYQESREDFESIDLVFIGLTTLGVYYILKRVRNKQ